MKMNFQKPEPQIGRDIVTLIPLIIGSAIIFLVTTFIAICIRRKKKSGTKYDLEKTEGKSEECEKLNTSLSEQPDVIRKQ